MINKEGKNDRNNYNVNYLWHIDYHLPDWKDWRKKEMSVLRSLARERARKRMEAIGMRRVCKKGSFHGLWRKFGGYGKEKAE